MKKQGNSGIILERKNIMQFQVPQFIDIEDKIFGPFTFKQFIYLAGGAGIAFVIYKILPLFLAILIDIPIIAFSLALAFYRINNKPFIFTVEAYINYFFQTKLYIWKKEKPQSKKDSSAVSTSASLPIPKLSDSKLKDLSWSLDVLDPKKKQ